MAEKDGGNWMKFAGFGLDIGAGTGLGAAAGYFIDSKIGAGHWALVIGAMLGCFGGMYLMIKEVIKMNKD